MFFATTKPFNFQVPKKLFNKNSLKSSSQETKTISQEGKVPGTSPTYQITWTAANSNESKPWQWLEILLLIKKQFAGVSKLWHRFNSPKQSRQTSTCCCKTPQSRFMRESIEFRNYNFRITAGSIFPVIIQYATNPSLYTFDEGELRLPTPVSTNLIPKRCFLAERHRESNLNSYFCVVFFVFSFFRIGTKIDQCVTTFRMIWSEKSFSWYRFESKAD